MPARANRSPATPGLLAVASRRVVYYLTPRSRSRRRPWPTLLRSDDAGRHFTPVATPTVLGRTELPRPVAELTFLDPRHGFAVAGSLWRGSYVVFTTDDGARSWHRARLAPKEPGRVSFAGGRRHAYAVAVSCTSGRRCSDLAVYGSRKGSISWHRVHGTGIPQVNYAGGVGLAASGSSVWLTVGNGESTPLLLHSTDRGQSFHRVAALPAVSCTPTATSASVVWLDCSTGLMWAGYRVGAHGSLSRIHLGGSSCCTHFFPLSDQTAFVVDASRPTGIWLTRDGGRSFRRTARVPRFMHGNVDATFLTARDGVWLSGHRILVTADGGRSWRPARLRHGPACRARDLRGAIPDRFGAAGGTAYSEVTLTNVGGSPCTLRGVPAVRFVAHGHVVGAVSNRLPGRPRPVWLAARFGTATIRLGIGEAVDYPKRLCRPTVADGFLVRLRGWEHSLFVPAVTATPLLACRKVSAHQLETGPFEPFSTIGGR